MAKTAFVGTRIDPALKAEVEQICAELGLSLSQAITLFLMQLKQHQGLPFEVRIASRATREALSQAQQPEGLRAAGDPEELYRDLGL